ncbi:MAG: hypothetical protein ACI9E1_002082 [Cryomorphaceae bacterium]|jgi:hypothetical protein
MEDFIQEEKILVFTRMPADGFDDFMGNPEAVIDTVEDMGFDQDEMLRSMTAAGDPSQIVQLMEGRWSGEEMNFAFENFWPSLLEKFPQLPGSAVLKMITKEGRHSQIHTDHGGIRVLSLDQVARAQKELEGMKLENLIPGDETDLMLEDLFPALQKFFTHAAGAGEFVLVSYI